MSAELKSCPFCGEVPTRIDYTDGAKWGAVVCCITGPEVRTAYQAVDHWRDEAIAAWNRRAPSHDSAVPIPGGADTERSGE